MQSDFVLSSPSLGKVTALPTPLTKRVVPGPDRETGAQVDRGSRVTEEGTSLSLTSGPCPRIAISESRFTWREMRD